MTRRPHVLIVDDELALLDLYEIWLGGLDVAISRASCGAEALERCHDGIDVVLLDRQMPRVSGDEVLDELRERGLDVRVAFVSAATPDVRITDIDIDAYLVKPVARDVYLDLVRSLLRRESLPETADRYVSILSKRAALLEAEPRSVLRNEPAYAALEAELSRLASRVDSRRLDDPFLRRASTDGSGDDGLPSFDSTL
ncbi:response regulator [Haloplanus salinus]|jgi:DNA-binding response OmpR family regulator|uniref:Response regulator n=1 Tax=Haloplanus salinus TaxID=1126245 RepID=A0A368NBE7_9EURY|nr:response regulator [Haloplanus salinus]RCU47440.1 response regulator [Haloplanus salinus]